ncbi:unnamed protein product, partial [Fusarium langsethiae]
MQCTVVENWLDSLDITYVDQPKPYEADHELYPHKQSQPPSPPETVSQNKRQVMSDDDNGPVPKRQRVQDDPDKTPTAHRIGSRQSKGFPNNNSPATALSARSESQSAHSQTSGRSSPSKQLASLEITPDWKRPRVLTLNNPQLPSALSEILVELQDCSGSGIGVISSDWQEEILKRSKTEPEFLVFRQHMFASSTERGRFGPTPSPSDVARLAYDAAEIQATSQNEAAWNMLVHCPLLYKTFDGIGQRQGQLNGFVPCTTAKIIREHLPLTTQPKMVDFCTYINTEADSIASEAIEKMRLVMPCNVINHTDYLSLRNRPIAISIETKAPDKAQSSSAGLQLATWHSAQWNFLQDLVSQSGGSMDGLPFL